MIFCHLSDIHWRGIARHKEYTDSFERLFDKIKKIEPDVIINCGDTFHTKTMGITPEIIERLSWMFRSLADIAPMYTLLGNHDGNLTNLQRQDVITPIHMAINHPRAHLLRRSGVYKIDEIKTKDVFICAYSPFDKKQWDKVKPRDDIENSINIAMYHGSIEDAKSDLGWVFDSEHSENNVSIFKGFDYIFLGDIHKQQFVRTRLLECEVDEDELKRLHELYGPDAFESIEEIK